MVWLVGIVVLVLLIFSGKFRKVAFGIVAVIAVGIGLIVLYTQEAKREARDRIAVSEIELQDIRLQNDYGSYRIFGRIKNNSHQYTLTRLGMKFSFEDCESDTPRLNCVTIGEAEENYSLNIPAGQAREFSEHVYPGSTRAKGKMVWHYFISYTEGR